MVSVDAKGASGGGDQPGLGGRVQADLSVSPGQVLNIFVGGAGDTATYSAFGMGGWNGGANGNFSSFGDAGSGGGGASDIRVGGIFYSDVVIVAGGGGGSSLGFTGGNGGDGGGIAGGSGLYTGIQNPAYAGQGGTQSSGGDGATYGPGTSGIMGSGGIASNNGYGGGGGGGYFGGGGGSYGGGGGGSDYTGTGTSNVIQSTGYQTGNGQIILSWNTQGCTSVRVSVTVIVGLSSTSAISATATPSNINSGSSSTLSEFGGSLGAGASWNWYSGYCGGTFIDSGASNIQIPTITTVYFVRAESACNTTLCVSVTIVVTSLSVAGTSAAASPSLICSGSLTTLSVSGGSLGTGANWYLYTGFCGGTFIVSGSSAFVSPTTVTTYYVQARGALNTTTCVSVTVTISSLSTQATSATGITPICTGSNITLGLTGGSLGTGATWNWYTGSCGGTTTGTGISVGESPTVTTVYWVRAEGICNTTICQSKTIFTIDVPSEVDLSELKPIIHKP